MMSSLFKLIDPRSENSLSLKLRRKRFQLVQDLILPLPMPLKIIDVGGEQIFWELMGVSKDKSFNVLIVNVVKEITHGSNFKSAIGDARDLREYRDGQFDLVFSNSVIEHLGTLSDQKKMAGEVQRIGKNYILQTPNRYFPIEPHHLFPFFNFLPLRLKVFLLSNFRITFSQKKLTKTESLKIAQEIRLLSLKEIKTLFPSARIYKERIFGLTKSFIVTSLEIKDDNSQ